MKFIDAVFLDTVQLLKLSFNEIDECKNELCSCLVCEIIIHLEMID